MLKRRPAVLSETRHGQGAAAILSVVLLACFTGCGSDARIRPARSAPELMASRELADQQRVAAAAELTSRHMAYTKAHYDDYVAGRTTTPPVVDMLIISGGGDWGAFGAGFLKGWGKVPAGPLARPQFDVVTGVSTGALIAPFAFLGDDASIEKVVHLYRNPKEDWVKPMGLIDFLRGSESYAQIPGLEHELQAALDLPTVRKIADAGKSGRILAVNTTDIDTSEMHAWDLVNEARRAADSGDVHRMQQILLASSAVPGAFPPREIDGTLYVDGGITGNILYPGGRSRSDNDTFIARWQEQYPGVPLPKVRYWVIFNNEIRWPPEVVQPKWSSVLAKTSTTSTRAATLNAMRMLFLQAQVAQLKYNADVQIRIVAVPDGWVPPKPGVFLKETMNALADLGEQMGADPASWRTTPP